jgi:hypothetical protein
VLKHSLGGKFSNELPAQFLESRQIFAGKDGGCGIAPVLEGRMSFFDSSQHYMRLRQMRKDGDDSLLATHGECAALDVEMLWLSL